MQLPKNIRIRNLSESLTPKTGQTVIDPSNRLLQTRNPKNKATTIIKNIIFIKIEKEHSRS